jgi:hypothetical protein
MIFPQVQYILSGFQNGSVQSDNEWKHNFQNIRMCLTKPNIAPEVIFTDDRSCLTKDLKGLNISSNSGVFKGKAWYFHCSTT